MDAESGLDLVQAPVAADPAASPLQAETRMLQLEAPRASVSRCAGKSGEWSGGQVSSTVEYDCVVQYRELCVIMRTSTCVMGRRTLWEAGNYTQSRALKNLPIKTYHTFFG